MRNMTDIIPISTETKLELPLFYSRVKAGFPSPADDYVDTPLDLNKHLIQHEQATFYVRAVGDSMIGSGINTGDLLIVDKAITPKNNSVVVACINGEFTVKHFGKYYGRPALLPANKKYPPIIINNETDFYIWGVVTHVIHSFK